jgi:hypothetical protein
MYTCIYAPFFLINVAGALNLWSSINQLLAIAVALMTQLGRPPSL